MGKALVLVVVAVVTLAAVSGLSEVHAGTKTDGSGSRPFSLSQLSVAGALGILSDILIGALVFKIVRRRFKKK